MRRLVRWMQGLIWELRPRQVIRTAVVYAKTDLVIQKQSITFTALSRALNLILFGIFGPTQPNPCVLFRVVSSAPPCFIGPLHS